MDLLVNAIGSSPPTKVKASGPTRSNRQPDTVSPGRSAEPSLPLQPEARAPVAVRMTVAAPERPEHKVTTTSLPQDRPVALQVVKRAVFEHDEASGLSIVKFLDSKGDVVMESPPENFIKTVQLLKEFGGVELQASSGETTNTTLTGMLFSKKV